MARAGLGWVAGTSATLLTTVVPATIASTEYWDLALWQGVVIALTVGQVFGAASFALAALLAGDPGRGPGALAALRVGAAWAGAEWVRSTALTGLPWLLLAHSLVPAPALIQAAEFGGELFVSFMIAVLNCGLLLAFLSGRRRAGLLVVAAVSIGFVAAALRMPGEGEAGSVRAAKGSPLAWSGSSRVLVVQVNLPNHLRTDPAHVHPALEGLVELSRRERPIDLTVWPENAVNVTLPMNENLVGTAARGLHSGYLLLGTPRIEGSARPALYNSAVLFGPDGHIRQSHDKRRLLPFAEYWPGPLGRLDLPGVITTAGGPPRVMVAGDLRLGSMICYEIVFAQTAHALVRDGAEVLVNLSNESWFESSGAIDQHFAAAIMRAVETRRPVLRSTQTGITAAIDSGGRVRARLPAERAGALEIEVRPSREKTWATRLGGAAGVCGLLIASAMTLHEVMAHRRRRGIASREYS